MNRAAIREKAGEERGPQMSTEVNGGLYGVAATMDAEVMHQAQCEDADSTDGEAIASNAGQIDTIKRVQGFIWSVTTKRGPDSPLSGKSLHKALRTFADELPGWVKRRLTFYRIHFVVFFVMMLIGTMIIYFSPNGVEGPLRFIDCMYVATTTLCVTGLIPVRMDQLSTFDKVVMILLMLLGSQVFTSLVPVLVRMHYFKKFLKSKGNLNIEGSSELPSMLSAGASGGSEHGSLSEVVPTVVGSGETERRSPESAGDVQAASAGRSPSSAVDLEAYSSGGKNRRSESVARQAFPGLDTLGDLPSSFLTTCAAASHTWAGESAEANARKLKAILEATKQTPLYPRPTSSYLPPLPRSLTSAIPSQVDGKAAVDPSTLAPGERRLIELHALQLLSWLVPIYFFGFQFLCFIALLICLVANDYYLNLLNANDINPAFMAAFHSVSAFNNAGMSLLDSSLMEFQAYLPYLTVLAVLILAGNTCYAPNLRFLLVIIRRFGTEHQRFVAAYLLEHPRRCYTHLFPPGDTKWLVFTVFVFNFAQMGFFFIGWNSPAFSGLPPQVKVLDAAFQSVSTRSAGFNVISLGGLYPALLVLMVGLMYVAVYPVYITRQRSREQREVYDDEDLQIFYQDLQEGVLEKGILAQTKSMLGRDSALVFLSIFLVCLIQNQQMLDDPSNFSVFNIIFEIVSAYGNVGLSLGYTCPADAVDCVSVPYSFSGVWNPLAKLIIILVMFLGRHRGLPDNIDAAIVIPGPKQFDMSIPENPTAEGAPILTRMQNIAAPRRTNNHVMRRSVSVAPTG